MKIFYLFFLALLNSANLFSQSQDETLIINSFNLYKSALVNEDGDSAINLIDSRSVTYYEDMLDKIIYSDSVTINSMPITDKLLILIVRLLCSKEEILSFNGEELFIYAVDNGLVGKNGIMNISLGDIQIEEKFAKAKLVIIDENNPFYIHFYNEDSEWKINLTSILQMTSLAFSDYIQKTGKTENELVLNLLRNSYGLDSQKNIWHPLE